MARRAVCQNVYGPDGKIIPRRYIVGHLFFRYYYLALHEQAFYGEDGLLPPADGHFLILKDFCTYELCVEAFNRGGGKSTLLKEMALRELTCFDFRVWNMCVATEKLIADKATPIKDVLRNNERLAEDYGNLSPLGKSDEEIRLPNGSMLRMLTVGSRQRGARCSVYALDDPEYDPEKKVWERYAELAAKLEYLIIRIAIPMLNISKMRFLWTGTMLGERSFLYHVCYSKDKRFQSWKRRIQRVDETNPETGEITKSNWEARFPVNKLGLLRETMGDEAYELEFENVVRRESERILQLQDLPHYYTLDKPVPNIDQRNEAHLPPQDAKMTYYYFGGYYPGSDGRIIWKHDTVNALTHFQQMTKVATIDYAKSMRSTADLKALAITGFCARNWRWLLDLWAGRMEDPDFVKLVIKVCAPWRVDIIAVEDVGIQGLLVSVLQNRIYSPEEEDYIPADWHPAVIPLKYSPGMDQPESKGPRIKVAMEYPIKKGHIKLPKSNMHYWPWNDLKRQIDNFTPDLKHLRHDDVIEAVSMANWVSHSRGSAEPTAYTDPNEDIRNLIKSGKPYVEGMNGLIGMPLSEIKIEHLTELIIQQQNMTMNESGELNVWDKPVAIG